MRNTLEALIHDCLCAHCAAAGLAYIWEYPLVRFADAADPLFAELRRLVTAEHFLPEDHLPGATRVISYFLPFKAALGQGNASKGAASPEWAEAYLRTCALADDINAALVDFLHAQGLRAAAPQNAGMISTALPKSRWSQRHVAYIAGHGTFGLNNMLISDKGSLGRYYSVLAALDVPADPRIREERCLFKRNKSCGLCLRRCEVNALRSDGFDRFRCLAQCLENERRYPGADVCGKCIVDLPCSRPADKMLGPDSP